MNEHEQHEPEEIEQIEDLDVADAQGDDVRGGEISLSYGKPVVVYKPQNP